MRSDTLSAPPVLVSRDSLLSQQYAPAGHHPRDRSFDSITEVVHQVPTIRDLKYVGGAVGGAFGVAAATAPADDLHAPTGRYERSLAIPAMARRPARIRRR